MKSDKMSLTLVTGFFRLRDRQVDEDEAFRQFEQLAKCGLPIILFLDPQLAHRSPAALYPNVRVVVRALDALWPFKQDDDRPLPENRNPSKDTRDFILLQNAKVDLLAMAAGLDGSSHFAWIDFGIMKIVRDADSFRQRLRALKPHGSCVLAPGCWQRGVQTDGVNWRFCGGFLLVDRNAIASLVAHHHKAMTSEPVLTWEVNVWAKMEREGFHFDWYKADHDDSIIGGARVALVMIVKNESAIIERCLASAVAFIDTWIICDTGSTDDTPAIVERFFAKHDMPGKLARTTFKDFAQARNEALDAARQVPGWDYALLIDADMVLRGDLDTTQLTAPAYRLMQRHGNLDYWNTRLVRRDVPACYFGVTHEYLSAPGYADLHTLRIDDYNDGGSKSDKYERDIRLLLQGIVDEPKNERYLFYLARTYRETGRHLEAIDTYRRRIERGGWDEEVWCSYYDIARSYAALGDEPNLIKACLDAYNFRPSRGEPLKLLAQYLRERSRNESACLFAEALAKIKYPGDLLFVERDVYEHGAAQEISIAGYWSKVPDRREAGYRACSELTTSFNEFIRNEARNNATHYAKSARDLMGAEVQPIECRPDDGYAPMNPSVLVTGDGRRLVLVRTVNYTVTAQGQYPTVDGSGIIRTRNYVVEMDAQWKPLRSSRIEDASGLPRNTFPVEGFEDCRLWADGDKFFASATVRDLGDGRCEMAILSLDEAWRVTSVDVVRDYHHDQAQKNWMPIVGQPGSFLYMCHPTIVVERVAGRTVEKSRDAPPVFLGEQRGSSQVVQHDGGWLCITHEVMWRPERVYMHRFVKLDERFRVVAVSGPFYFLNVGIEFCAGLARDGDKLVASFGVSDASAHLALFDSERVEQALMNVGVSADTQAKSKPVSVVRESPKVSPLPVADESWTTSDGIRPLVSVVIPCYRQAHCLGDAIGSVLAQTYRPYEIIVVCGDEESELEARKYQEPNVRVIPGVTRGLADARNVGIAAAQGTLILPLDADDMIAPTFLAKTVPTATADPMTVVGTHLQEFGAQSGRFAPSCVTDHRMLSENPMYCCSLYSKSLWQRVGGYNVAPFGFEDWSFWISCVEAGAKLVAVPEPLFRYRIHSGNTSGFCAKHEGLLKAMLRLLHPAVSKSDAEADLKIVRAMPADALAAMKRRQEWFPDNETIKAWVPT